MKYDKAWIGKKVRHNQLGNGIIKAFTTQKNGDYVIIVFENIGSKMQPYPECFFNVDTYTLEPSMKQDFMRLNSKEWREYQEALSTVKNITLRCDVCNQIIKASNHRKLIIRQRYKQCLCWKCLKNNKKDSAKEQNKDREQAKEEKKERWRWRKNDVGISFDEVRKMMNHSMPKSSKKSYMHPTDGMNMGDW